MSTEELLQRITVSPEICHGKPCVRGMRYPVTMLLELLIMRIWNARTCWRLWLMVRVSLTQNGLH